MSRGRGKNRKKADTLADVEQNTWLPPRKIKPMMCRDCVIGKHNCEVNCACCCNDDDFPLNVIRNKHGSNGEA